jgi:hypothetical protein
MRHTKRVDETQLIASPANWLMDPYIAAIVVCCWLGPIINQAYYNGPSVVNDKFAVYYNEPLTPFWRALYSMDLLTTRSPAQQQQQQRITRQPDNKKIIEKTAAQHTRQMIKKNIDETGAEDEKNVCCRYRRPKKKKEF